MLIWSHRPMVVSKALFSASLIGSARLAKRFACSICTKFTASRSASSTARRCAAVVGNWLNSSSWDRSSPCAAATLASGTCSSQALQVAASVNSGEALPKARAASWRGIIPKDIAVAHIEAREKRRQEQDHEGQHKARRRQLAAFREEGE